MDVSIWIPVVSTAVTTMGVIWVAKINRENKPIKEVLKRTNFDGDGSLVEAMGTLSREYRESQERHTKEISYFMKQLAESRSEINKMQRLIEAKDTEILTLERIVAEHEARLNARKDGHA